MIMVYNIIMKIGKFEIENLLIAGPMAGYSDIGFRKFCVEYGADWAVTEMISIKGLYYDDEKTKRLLATTDAEKIKVCQLFGSDPEIFGKVVNNPALEKFDIIDINMGCPAPKIFNNKEGSYLMSDHSLSEKIIKACVENTDKPISVKFRLGVDEKHKNAVEFAQMCERAGASLITVHGRTRDQFYSGVADYDEIAKVVKAVSIPVVANGDVRNLIDYNRIKKTGAAGVMIARGAIGNMKIFSEIRGIEKEFDKAKIIIEHFDLLLSIYSERTSVFEFRKHLVRYTSNRSVKNEIMKITSAEELKKYILSVKDII